MLRKMLIAMAVRALQQQGSSEDVTRAPINALKA